MTIRAIIRLCFAFGILASANADASDVSVSPTLVDFGMVPNGTTSSPRIVAVVHVGIGVAHHVTRVAKSGVGCGSYAISGVPLGHTIDGSGNVEPPLIIDSSINDDFLSITFSPMTVGSQFECTVTLENSVGAVHAGFGLRGVSTASSSPEIVLSPLSISVGTITLGQMGTGQITVENTGNATLTYSFAVSGPGFATTACMPSCSLVGGGMTSHAITFSPPGVGPSTGQLVVTSNDPDEGTTMIPLAGTGASGGSGGLVSPTTGVLAFGKVPVGSTATRSFTVMNGGSGAIELSSATFGSAVFAIGPATPLPITVAVGDSVDIDLTCTPGGRTTYTAAANVTTTAGNGNLGLSLSCTGAAEVTLPTSIAFGVTAVGTEVRLAEAIDLHNINRSASFVVRELRLTDDTGAFAIDADPAAIAPDAHLLGDASFTPTAPGPYLARVEVYLDDDPTIHGEIVLTGHAIELAPTGGCAAGGPLGLAMIGVVLFSLRRRRVAALAVLLVIPASARADTVVGQTYRPAVSVGEHLFQVESAAIAPTSWALGLAAGYARDPLRLELVDCGGECPPGFMQGETSSLIRSQGLFALGAAFAFAGKVELGVSMPLLVQTGHDSPFAPAASGTALGDIAAQIKVVALRRSALTIGGTLTATAPTATEGQYAGSSGPSGRLGLLVGWDRAPLHVAVEAGLLGRKATALAAMRQGSELDAGLGLAYEVHDRVTLTAEAFGSLGLVESSQVLLQSLVGVRARPIPEVTIGVAGGAALVAGAGAPSIRGLVVLTYAPARRAPKINAGTVVVAVPDRRDQDRDGTDDPADRCPAEAEDRDGHDDGDGCPDPDDDGDGVLDAADRCRAEAEDRDGFDDGDGCPDPDNDGDGIADATDRCPIAAGPAGSDGCPDDDRDRDGVADGSDRCPAEAETINGKTDDDGCPDAGDSLVLIGRTRIDLFDAIRFAGEAVDPASANVLSQLALALRADRSITRVQVIVHVRAGAGSALDLELSRRRAAAVVEALISRGVAATRLEAIGAGSEKPLGKAPPQAAINDRVELSIASRNPSP